MALVTSNRPGMPCASIPNSFPYNVTHSCWYFGFCMRCRYSISSPVSSPKTAFSISMEIRRLSNAHGVTLSWPMFSEVNICWVDRQTYSTQDNIFSWPIDKFFWLLLLCSGDYFCANLGDRRSAGACTQGGARRFSSSYTAAAAQFGIYIVDTVVFNCGERRVFWWLHHWRGTRLWRSYRCL